MTVVPRSIGVPDQARRPIFRTRLLLYGQKSAIVKTRSRKHGDFTHTGDRYRLSHTGRNRVKLHRTDRFLSDPEGMITVAGSADSRNERVIGYSGVDIEQSKRLETFDNGTITKE